MQKLVTALLPLAIMLAGGAAWLVKEWQYGGYLTAVFRLRRKTPHA